MRTKIDENVKNEILERYHDYQQNILENNSEILIAYDEFKQIVVKFEKRNKCKIDVENLPVYDTDNSTASLKETVENLLANPTVENYADFADFLDSYIDFMVNDINTTISSMSTTLSKPLIEYQYVEFITFINKNKILLNNFEKIIENINKL